MQMVCHLHLKAHYYAHFPLLLSNGTFVFLLSHTKCPPNEVITLAFNKKSRKIRRVSGGIRASGGSEELIEMAC